MTKTATRLYISQQTLSNHILRLEEQFGTPLFTRKPGLALTMAGRYVLEFARDVNRGLINVQSVISDIDKQERGVINFGASSFRANSCIPQILPAFTERYPHVELRINDMITEKLLPKVLNGDLDMAVVSDVAEHSELVTEPIMDDDIYLCVADSLLRQYYGDETDALIQKSQEGAWAKDFEKLPFCVYTNQLGKNLFNCFEESGFKPRLYMSSSYLQMGFYVISERLAAGFATKMMLNRRTQGFPEDIHIFPLRYRGGLMSMKVSLISRKSRCLPSYTQLFGKLVAERFGEMNRMKKPV